MPGRLGPEVGVQGLDVGPDFWSKFVFEFLPGLVLPVVVKKAQCRKALIQFPRINPSSLFRSTWVLATISTILFTTITLPYRLAFIPLPHDAHWGFAVTDAIRGAHGEGYTAWCGV